MFSLCVGNFFQGPIDQILDISLWSPDHMLGLLPPQGSGTRPGTAPAGFAGSSLRLPLKQELHLMRFISHTGNVRPITARHLSAYYAG